jgi:adenylate cyclase
MPAFRTIMFTDIASSTPLLAELRDAKMREVMRGHDEVLAAAVARHSGHVIKTIGDGLMAEFAVPSSAVAAAIEAQRGIREKFAANDLPVRVRIGINAGEPIEEDGDLHGACVVVAKRLEGEAAAGGILVSDIVKQAVAGKEFVFEDQGLVSLKGFDEPIRAWSVSWD